MKITGIHRVELLVEDPATVADTFNELFDISFSHDPDTADHGTKCYMAAEAGLEFLNLMNAEVEIDPRPSFYLTENEKTEAENSWGGRSESTKRIIIAPGGGFPEKCWGEQNFSHLINLLLKNKDYQLCIIGSKEDKNRISANNSSQLTNLCGKLSLRQSAAIVSVADFVVCNTSLCMHLAGAFKIPALTLLGEWYDSAQLHQKQWGYPESTIKGKELKAFRKQTCSVSEAYELILQGL